MNSFQDVIDAWPSKAELAVALETSTPHVQKMRDRDNIPSRYWLRLCQDAKRRKIPVNEQILIKLAAQAAA